MMLPVEYLDCCLRIPSTRREIGIRDPLLALLNWCAASVSTVTAGVNTGFSTPLIIVALNVYLRDGMRPIIETYPSSGYR